MTTYRLFSGVDGPGSQAGDSENYTLAVEFYVTAPGHTLTQVHFWASGTVTGSDHACRLYAVDGGNSETGLLVSGSSKAFTSPLVAGWNTVTLNTPVALTANQRYRAAVFFTTDNGYTATGAYWTSGAGASGITSGPLVAPNNAAARGTDQGSFVPADAYPSDSFNGGNYWVDVTIFDGVADGSVTGVVAASLPALTGSLAGVGTDTDVVLGGSLPALTGQFTDGSVAGSFTGGGASAVVGVGVPGQMVPGSFGGAPNLPALTGALTGDVTGPLFSVVAAQHPGLSGIVPELSAADPDGNVVTPNVRLLIINGSGSEQTLTIDTPGTARGDLAIDDRVVVLLAAGSFPGNATLVDVPGSVYVQADGYCHLSWSAVTSVSFAAFGQVAT